MVDIMDFMADLICNFLLFVYFFKNKFYCNYIRIITMGACTCIGACLCLTVATVAVVASLSGRNCSCSISDVESNNEMSKNIDNC
jgi:hypothetical protein